jgi:hypothetical protein
MKKLHVRHVLFALVSLAVSACNWVNVGGPW